MEYVALHGYNFIYFIQMVCMKVFLLHPQIIIHGRQMEYIGVTHYHFIALNCLAVTNHLYALNLNNILNSKIET